MYAKSLIQYFEEYLPLTEEEALLLSERVTHRKVRRRQFILQEGDVCKRYSFILQGCFKMFNIDDRGIEHIIEFGTEKDWMVDIGSFYTERPGRLFIEALEPSEVLQIEKSDLLFLFTNVLKLNRTFRVIIENKFVALQDRVLQNISSTAQERYLSFLEYHPGLAQRLPGTQIASYLGITPEFLSKIRRNVLNKK